MEIFIYFLGTVILKKQQKHLLGFQVQYRQGDDQVVRLLLEAGANRDIVTRNSLAYNALMLAAAMGRVEAVRLLLEAGADKDRVNCVGDTALMRAAAHGQVEAVPLSQLGNILHF